MPSTDIMTEGKIGLRLTAKFKFNDEAAKKRFSSFVPRAVYGVGKNVEIGVNLNGNTQPGVDATTLVLAAKWRFYQSEKYDVAVVAGNSFYVPLRHKKYNAGNYFYVAGSKGFESGTKVTVGSYYYTANVVAKNASRVGGQFGLEQKLTPKIAFAAEYYTGKHSAGGLTAGFKAKINKRTTANLGYTIANQKAAQGNHYFYASIGVNLN